MTKHLTWSQVVLSRASPGWVQYVYIPERHHMCQRECEVGFGTLPSKNSFPLSLHSKVCLYITWKVHPPPHSLDATFKMTRVIKGALLCIKLLVSSKAFWHEQPKKHNECCIFATYLLLSLSFARCHMTSLFLVVLGPQSHKTKYTFDSKVALKLVCHVK